MEMIFISIIFVMIMFLLSGYTPKWLHRFILWYISKITGSPMKPECSKCGFKSECAKGWIECPYIEIGE
ncbi:hypothetical protein KAR91_57080 [Candidatus Pacearchaeota archaeon]|nr:hypothetical protein [Candidatus Pacearchaeota archaeon]